MSSCSTTTLSFSSCKPSLIASAIGHLRLLIPLACLASVLLAIGPAPAPAENEAFRLYVEAEDCDVPRYPYDDEGAPGWYARETCSRAAVSGHGWVAAIHETATQLTMTHKLAKPIPAGKYRVFLRTLGPAHIIDTTSVAVAIGETAVTFKCDGGKKIAWTAGQEISLDKPATTISFTALSFGGMGNGSLFECRNRSMWLDTLYITSDLKEKAPPALEAETALRAGVAPLPPRPKYENDDTDVYDPATPAPLAPVVADPVLLQSFDGRRNLWPNSSFELGMNDGWSSDNRSKIYVFTDKDLDDRQPVDGKYSLHVPAGAAPFSRPYYLNEGGDMMLSMYVRGSGKFRASLMRVKNIDMSRNGADKQIDTEAVIRMTMVAGKDWQRISAKTGLREANPVGGWYYLYLQCEGETWIDAVQLEKGKFLTPYAPRAILEGALRTSQLGNILYDTQKNLTAWFHNSGDKPLSAQLQYRTVDIRESVVAQGLTPAVEVKPGATVKKDVDFLPPLRGIFSVTYAIADRKMPEGETVYAVVPQPATHRTRHMLGANTDLDAHEIAVQGRMGIREVLTCNSPEVGAAYYDEVGGHPAPEIWTWYDDRAAIPAKYGAEFIPCFWPGNIPLFMQDPIPTPYRVTRGNARGHVPKMDLWKDYLTKLVAHYKPYVTMWCTCSTSATLRDRDGQC